MREISASALRDGDIIVSTTDALVSGVIRVGTGSSVSHSMIYVGNQKVVEAIAPGVKKRTLSLAIEDASLAIVLRRRNATPVIRREVVRRAEVFANRNLPYDEVGAAGAGVSVGRGRALAIAGCSVSPMICRAGNSAVNLNASPLLADRAFFCSELVARVYELADAPITDRPASFTTPRQVRQSSALLYVGHLKDT